MPHRINVLQVFISPDFLVALINKIRVNQMKGF